MHHRLKLLSASLLLLCGLGYDDTGYAAEPDATLNQCWGDIASQFAQRGLVGEHSRAGSDFTSQPRDGVANQGIEIGAGEPGDGGNGQHAILVGDIVDDFIGGEPILCDGTPGNPGPAIP